MKKVFVIGGASYDSIIYLPQFPGNIPQTIHQCKFQETLGSTGIGKALNLEKLDFKVTLHALIGNDVWGKKIISSMQQSPVKFLYHIDENGTERHTNIMNRSGERISIFTNTLNPEGSINFNEIKAEVLQADYVVVNLTDYCKPIIKQVHSLEIPIWTDLHDYDGRNPWHEPFIEYSNYIFLSSDNLPDYKPFMQEMIDAGKELVVVTHGKKGSTALTKNGEWIETEAFTNYELIDSNGAGDAYFSGFLYGYNQNKTIIECMKLGSIVGALCINSNKLSNSNLTYDMIEKLFNEMS
ncbi:carbohydrate kinase family protein [Plebeiibacterium marinum]|uniref:Carbohydrate kinase family protein n=1 Tax=Plebeiibacterium marinum TaxID=2992111 RepID=A0AAE3MIB3_9BACT|nr:carbohydrate kinase family protein [Plebeiobacterium marinum]MCW3808049.1 carbohydrate kinase family protein [Plebeiobacterium marinum]